MNERNSRIALITAKCLGYGEVVHVFDPTGVPGSSSWSLSRAILNVLRTINGVEIVTESNNTRFSINTLLAIVSAITIEGVLLAILVRNILVGIKLVSLLYLKTLQTRIRRPDVIRTRKIRSEKAKVSRTLLYRNIVALTLYAL